VQAPKNDKAKALSDVLREIQATVAGGGVVTVGYFLRVLGVRGFGFLTLVLALLNVVIFVVPGLSLVLGLCLIILSVQMLLGLHTPLFPAFVRRRKISRVLLSKGLDVGSRAMARVEHLIRPRYNIIAGPHMDRLHSLFALLMAVMMMIPIPLLNIPPSLGLIALAIGVMQRDGVFIAGSYALAGWSLWLFSSLSRVAHALAQ
jgi:hypothetical protein